VWEEGRSFCCDITLDVEEYDMDADQLAAYLFAKHDRPALPK